jgi:hypothetical protein
MGGSLNAPYRHWTVASYAYDITLTVNALTRRLWGHSTGLEL